MFVKKDINTKTIKNNITFIFDFLSVELLFEFVLFLDNKLKTKIKTHIKRHILERIKYKLFIIYFHLKLFQINFFARYK